MFQLELKNSCVSQGFMYLLYKRTDRRGKRRPEFPVTSELNTNTQTRSMCPVGRKNKLFSFCLNAPEDLSQRHQSQQVITKGLDHERGPHISKNTGAY